MPPVAPSAEALARLLQEFLAEYPDAIVSEEGQTLFDFSNAHYSVSGDSKCVLHLWSEERNVVRRIVNAEASGSTIRLQVMRFGHAQPNMMEVSLPSQPGVSARRRARCVYQKLLERVLTREYPGFRLDKVSNAPDLEHSLSPVYTRGLLRAGQTLFAVLGVCSDETQASVDAALTFGILWMDNQRDQFAGRAEVEGLKLFLPPGR